MQHFQCSLLLSLVVVVAAFTTAATAAAAAPGGRVKRQQLAATEEQQPHNADELNPINAEEVVGVVQERNKRKLPDATFEAKNAVLGFVFGSQGYYKRQRSSRGALGGGKNSGDAAELDSSNVSFELPDDLFNKSFQTVTSISKSISRLLMNSARRYSRFVLFFKPIFGDALVVKGSEDPTTTTTTTTTTERSTTLGATAMDADMINEI